MRRTLPLILIVVLAALLAGCGDIPRHEDITVRPKVPVENPARHDDTMIDRALETTTTNTLPVTR